MSDFMRHRFSGEVPPVAEEGNATSIIEEQVSNLFNERTAKKILEEVNQGNLHAVMCSDELLKVLVSRIMYLDRVVEKLLEDKHGQERS